ncbi:hypothetical protein [Longispora albida]|nr:hypothetical protein [Longispora albida]
MALPPKWARQRHRAVQYKISVLALEVLNFVRFGAETAIKET